MGKFLEKYKIDTNTKYTKYKNTKNTKLIEEMVNINYCCCLVAKLCLTLLQPHGL